MNRLLEKFYEEHHIKKQRLRRSFMEETRARLFSTWLGHGKKILDLGCRDGTLTRHFMQGDNKVIGGDIDISSLMYASVKYGFETIQINLNDILPFDDNEFDAIAMGEVIEHLPYPDISLKESCRVLKYNGIFVGSVPLAYHLNDRYRVLRGKKLIVAGDDTHLQYLSYDDLICLLSKYFDVEEIRVLKGSKWARFSVRMFARNVAFKCVNNK